MRLDKFLCECAFGTRTEVKSAVKAKLVTVNGKIVTDCGFSVSEKDEIFFSGKRALYSKYVYIMLNKPMGTISAVTDKEKTVIDLIEQVPKRGLFPVGRLDKDTEGLLIITNDGELAHKLLSPKKHVDKKYYFKFSGTMPENAVSLFKEGIKLKDFTCRQAILEIISENEAYVTIHEGKYHQVKRMVRAVGCEVEYLKRTAFGQLKLDESLLPGQSRLLTPKEVELLK